MRLLELYLLAQHKVHKVVYNCKVVDSRCLAIICIHPPNFYIIESLLPAITANVFMAVTLLTLSRGRFFIASLCHTRRHL